MVEAEITSGQRAAHRETAAGVVILKIFAIQPHQYRIKTHQCPETAWHVGQLHRAAYPKYSRREGVVARLNVPANAQLVHHRIDIGREAARNVAILNLQLWQPQPGHVVRAIIADVKILEISLSGYVVEYSFQGLV